MQSTHSQKKTVVIRRFFTSISTRHSFTQVKLLLLHCIGEIGKECDLSSFPVQDVIVASFRYVVLVVLTRDAVCQRVTNVRLQRKTSTFLLSGLSRFLMGRKTWHTCVYVRIYLLYMCGTFSCETTNFLFFQIHCVSHLGEEGPSLLRKT
jgi:hypothetical protein